MAQMKPNSSRPIAVTTFPLFLPRGRQFPITRMQPMLRFPGDLADFFTDHLLPFAQRSTYVWPVPVCPGGLNTTRRKWAFPVLVMLPRRVLFPLECSLATIPP